MPARSCSPKAVHSFLVAARKSNSDPALVRASGMMNGLAMWNVKKRRIWDHGGWQAEWSERLEDMGRALGNRKSSVTSIPGWRKKNYWNRWGRGEQPTATVGKRSQLQRKGDATGASLKGSPAQPQWDEEPLPAGELRLGGEGKITLRAERDLPSGTK